MSPDVWRQVEQLFHEALELAPEQRAQFVAQAFPHDEAARTGRLNVC